MNIKFIYEKSSWRKNNQHITVFIPTNCNKDDSITKAFDSSATYRKKILDYCKSNFIYIDQIMGNKYFENGITYWKQELSFKKFIDITSLIQYLNALSGNDLGDDKENER